MKKRDSVSKYAGNQWYMVWNSFQKNKLAVVSLVLIVIMYIVVVFAGFFAPYNHNSKSSRYSYGKPTKIHVRDAEGNWQAPFVYGTKQVNDPVMLTRTLKEDTSVIYPIRFFVKGESYRILWFETDIHLFGVSKEDYDAGGRVFLCGTDKFGRDLLSRLAYGGRVSLSVGILGQIITTILALIIGTIAGYFGGVADIVISRIIEVLSSIPTLPLWLVLGSLIPASWSPVKTYFFITLILCSIYWVGGARATRGRIMQIKQMDYVKSGVLDNASTPRLIRKYLVPYVLPQNLAGFASAIPGLIIGETSMSFIGLGMQAPAVSWGVLLADAQSLNVIIMYPWLMFAILPVIITCVLFNFLGDGMRNAFDPYKD